MVRWELLTARMFCPAEAVAETGAGLGSPQGSLKLRKSEMEALFMDL